MFAFAIGTKAAVVDGQTAAASAQCGRSAAASSGQAAVAVVQSVAAHAGALVQSVAGLGAPVVALNRQRDPI